MSYMLGGCTLAAQVRMIHDRNADAVNSNQNAAWGTIIGFAAMDTDTDVHVVVGVG